MSLMKFPLVLVCVCVATVAADLRSLSAEKILHLIRSWNLDDEFVSVFEAKRYDGYAVDSMTKEDFDAEFPNASPIHRRALYSRIQDIKYPHGHPRRLKKKSDWTGYGGVTLSRDTAFITFGKNKEIKIFRDKKGTLRLEADAIDFVSKKLTVNDKPLAIDHQCLVNNGGCDILRECFVDDKVGSKKCGNCPDGYANDGPKRCKDVDVCLKNNGGCHPARQCHDAVGSMACGDCAKGFKNVGAKGCKDVNECLIKNGGCHAKRECINKPGTWSCGKCGKGYQVDGAKGCKEARNLILGGRYEIPEQWLKQSGKNKLGPLIYKGSRDGFSSSGNFHPKVDNKGPTLVVFEHAQGWVFGGYTQLNWKATNNYARDTTAFLWFLKCRAGLKAQRLNVKRSQYAIYRHNGHGPTFGGGHDIYCSSDIRRGYLNWGHSYNLPSGQNYRFLTGVGGGTTQTFAKEVEVYQVL